jgi:uncharacterized protein YdhG (YjbR/CyaY superfamily)
MTPKTVDEYIAAFAPEVQAILQKIRATVRRAAPGAEERIRSSCRTYRSMKGKKET